MLCRQNLQQQQKNTKKIQTGDNPNGGVLC